MAKLDIFFVCFCFDKNSTIAPFKPATTQGSFPVSLAYYNGTTYLGEVDNFMDGSTAALFAASLYDAYHERGAHNRWKLQSSGWNRSGLCRTSLPTSRTGTGHLAVERARPGSAAVPPLPPRLEGFCWMADPMVSASPNELSGTLNGETILLSSTTNLYYGLSSGAGPACGN